MTDDEQRAAIAAAVRADMVIEDLREQLAAANATIAHFDIELAELRRTVEIALANARGELVADVRKRPAGPAGNN